MPQNAPGVIILHLLLKKFAGGDTPVPPSLAKFLTSLPCRAIVKSAVSEQGSIFF